MMQPTQHHTTTDAPLEEGAHYMDMDELSHHESGMDMGNIHGMDDNIQILQDLDDIFVTDTTSDAISTDEQRAREDAEMVVSMPVWQQLVLQDATPEQICNSHIAVGSAIRYAPEDVLCKLRHAIAEALNGNPSRCHFIEHMFTRTHAPQLSHAALTQAIRNHRIRALAFETEQRKRDRRRHKLHGTQLEREIIDIKSISEGALVQLLQMELSGPQQIASEDKITQLTQIRDTLSSQAQALNEVLKKL